MSSSSRMITRSPLQYRSRPDGSVEIAGHPGIQVLTHERQASTEFPAWERELGLPIYQEEWEQLAEARGLSGRFIRFVLLDSSITRLTDHRRYRPADVRSGLAHFLTLGHNPYVIGLTRLVFLVRQGDRAGFGIPAAVEGDCLIGLAQLYDSGLANAAWAGLERKIFNSVCAVVGYLPGDPVGVGRLAEVALTTQAEAGCPGAAVLGFWKG